MSDDIQYAGVSGNTVSIFQENYEYARSQGMSRTEAHQTAIDYYRKHTAREHTANWSEEHDRYAEEDVVPVEDLLSYNQLVQRLDEISSPEQRQFLYATIRMEGLDSRLDPRNAARCQEICGNFYPVMVRDIAEWMELKVRDNGSCTGIARYRKQLQGLTAAVFGSQLALVR